MPRSLTVLEDELRTRVWVPSEAIDTVLDTAQAWADAYGIYAADALACGLPPLPGQIDLAKVRLRAGLVPAFSLFDPVTTALGMQTAFMAFWTPFLFTGSAVVLPGTPTLALALTTQWGASPLLSDVDVAVAAHAAILHAWTTMVAVGPPCNAPIT
jgi:hypothetical protein